MGSFWLTRVWFGSLNRCRMQKQGDYWGLTILEIRTFPSPRIDSNLFGGARGCPLAFRDWICFEPCAAACHSVAGRRGWYVCTCECMCIILHLYYFHRVAPPSLLFSVQALNWYFLRSIYTAHVGLCPGCEPGTRSSHDSTARPFDLEWTIFI